MHLSRPHTWRHFAQVPSDSNRRPLWGSSRPFRIGNLTFAEERNAHARSLLIIGSGCAHLRGVPCSSHGSSPADRHVFDSQFHLLFALPWNSISGGRAARVTIRIQPLLIVHRFEEDARLLVKCFLNNVFFSKRVLSKQPLFPQTKVIFITCCA